MCFSGASLLGNCKIHSYQSQTNSKQKGVVLVAKQIWSKLNFSSMEDNTFFRPRFTLVHKSCHSLIKEVAICFPGMDGMWKRRTCLSIP